MKIILLSGNSNTGKTTALGKLAEELEKKAEDITDGNQFADYILDYNGKKVAIRFDGDSYHWLIETIVGCSYCDVLVLAYSDKFSRSLAELVKKCPSQCGHKIVEKREIGDSDDERVCNEIIALL